MPLMLAEDMADPSFDALVMPPRRLRLDADLVYINRSCGSATARPVSHRRTARGLKHKLDLQILCVCVSIMDLAARVVYATDVYVQLSVRL